MGKGEKENDEDHDRALYLTHANFMSCFQYMLWHGVSASFAMRVSGKLRGNKRAMSDKASRC